MFTSQARGFTNKKSGEAPAGPEHQQRPGVRDQDYEVEAKQEAVEF